MKIAIGADHGGFEVKEAVRKAMAGRYIEVEDLGCYEKVSVDFADYAKEVAMRVSRGTVDTGILVCTSGIGMCIAANKFPGVRAALCLSPDMAVMARNHNDANILVLAGGFTPEKEAIAILNEWLENGFKGLDKYVRRNRKIRDFEVHAFESIGISAADPEAYLAIEKEVNHLNSTIDLIASENYASLAVRQAQGSVMTNKYAEGYPGKRYYNGCENVDVIERLAIERAKKLFPGAEHVNVQSHCGSSANMAAYFAVLNPGDTVLAMSLAHGGHLTHGHKVNFSGRLYNIVSYGVQPDSERIDVAEVAKLARQHKPKLIVVGASAYPRHLDFKAFREVADDAGALLMVDMAHIAGLIAGGCHPDPVKDADIVTSTTHKTLRGPRSGMIICKERLAVDIDRQVFPGIQGGPLMHVVAAKAVCFHEALQPSFKMYASQILANAKAMAETLQSAGLRLVSGGTDNHMMLVDLSSTGLTGKDAAEALDHAGIIVNKNAIPFDQKSAVLTSGIRIGTPAVTTRGMKEREVKEIAGMIVSVLKNHKDQSTLIAVRKQSEELAWRFPVP